MTALPANPGHHGRLGAISARLPPLRLSYDDFGIAAMLCDAFAVVCASALTGSAYHWIAFGRIGSLGDYTDLGLILAAFTAILMKLKGLYASDGLLSPRCQTTSILWVWGISVLFLLATSFSLKPDPALSRGWILSFALVAPVLMLCHRALLQRVLVAILDQGWLERRNVLLVTDEKTATATYEGVHPYRVLRTYVLPEDPDGVHSTLAGLTTTLRGDENVSEIHVAVDWSHWPGAKQALSGLRTVPVPVRLIADGNAREILQYRQQKLCGTVSFELQRAPLSKAERAAKRLIDVALAACGVLALAPLLVMISLAIRIESPGPILFHQRRGGFNGRAFQILKFRTMYVLEDGKLIIQASRDDCRVTRVGRFLRRWSLDELPQLINVLRGDMSLVGPRPHALAHDAQYRALISDYPFRHYVKPGITGWAQVNGFRGETRVVALMKQRVDLDLWYVANWSFWLDLRILLRTAWAITRSHDAF